MKIGFIGGKGHHCLRVLAKSDRHEVESVAVAGDGLDDEAARAFAGRLPGVRWYDSGEKMLEEFGADYISIGAVYGANGDWAAKSLERGCPTVCEKPLASTWEQLEVLREIVRSQGGILLTEFPFRSQPAFRAARAATISGRLGKVVLVTAQKSYTFGSNRPSWYAQRRLYGGTILWVASHAIDVIRYATEKRFVRVSGRQGNLSRPDYGEMEDHTVSLFELEGGASAVVHADYLRPAKASSHGDDRLRIAGSEGVVEVRDNRAFLVTNDSEEIDITDDIDSPTVQEELLASLRGEEGGIYNTTASLEIAQVLLCARDAADSGRVVEIEAQ